MKRNKVSNVLEITYSAPLCHYTNQYSDDFKEIVYHIFKICLQYWNISLYIYITIDLIASLIHVGNKGRYINNKFIE